MTGGTLVNDWFDVVGNRNAEDRLSHFLIILKFLNLSKTSWNDSLALQKVDKSNSVKKGKQVDFHTQTRK